MIETIVNITTRACYLVTAGVIVKYIYSRFVRHKNHQGTNIPMVKKQTIVALVENPSLYEDTSSAKGIDISKAAASSGHGSAVPPSARYSTLQDLDAGRHTEIDMFSGALMRMGQELGIPVPYNEFAYHMIKAIEEKNDGRFDYSNQDKRMSCSK